MVTRVFVAVTVLTHLEDMLWKHNFQGKVENWETAYIFVEIQILVLENQWLMTVIGMWHLWI